MRPSLKAALEEADPEPIEEVEQWLCNPGARRIRHMHVLVTGDDSP